MGVAAIVLWITIGIVYVVYKLGAERFGSALIGIACVLLIAACFASLGAAIKLTDSLACSFLAGILPICILYGWAGSSMAKGVTMFKVFVTVIAPFGLVDLFRNQNPLGLFVVAVAVIIHVYEKDKSNKGTDDENKLQESPSFSDDFQERKAKQARELQDKTHIPPACVFMWAENERFCELLVEAKKTSVLNDSIVLPIMQQVLEEQKPKRQLAFNMRSSIIAVRKALQDAAEGRNA